MKMLKSLANNRLNKGFASTPETSLVINQIKATHALLISCHLQRIQRQRRSAHPCTLIRVQTFRLMAHTERRHKEVGIMIIAGTN